MVSVHWLCWTGSLKIGETSSSCGRVVVDSWSGVGKGWLAKSTEERYVACVLDEEWREEQIRHLEGKLREERQKLKEVQERKGRFLKIIRQKEKGRVCQVGLVLPKQSDNVQRDGQQGTSGGHVGERVMKDDRNVSLEKEREVGGMKTTCLVGGNNVKCNKEIAVGVCGVNDGGSSVKGCDTGESDEGIIDDDFFEDGITPEMMTEALDKLQEQGIIY